MTANGNQDTSDWRRTLVIGNGGSGKTWLARRIAETRDLPVVHLDDLHWLPGRYGTARDKTEVAEDVKAAAAEKRWVIKGVYGLSANIALPRVTAFVWLDLPEDACIENVRRRGRQGRETQTQFTGLLDWIAGLSHPPEQLEFLRCPCRDVRCVFRSEVPARKQGCGGRLRW